MVRLLLALALLCVTAHAMAQTKGDPAAGAAQTERLAAGKVELTEGDVRFADTGNRIRRPRVGDAIYEGEAIATGADGEVHLQMEDGGYMAVRPNTRMRIVKFRAQADAEDRSVIALLQGSFRAVTGWIAKGGRDRVVVNTTTATIGIRGTEHEPLVIPQGSTLGEPGTYERVHAGETEIRTKQGTVAVRPNQAGFAASSGAVRPRVLDRVPAFFRPTRNEGRFAGRHERVSRQLDQHREERRRFIEERRKAKGQPPGERRREKGAEARDEKKQRAQDQKSEVRDGRKRKADEQPQRSEQKKQQRPPDKQLERREDKKQKAAEARGEHGKGGK